MFAAEDTRAVLFKGLVIVRRREKYKFSSFLFVIVVIWAATGAMFISGGVVEAEDRKCRVAAILSSDIRPYIEAMEGIGGSLEARSDFDVSVIHLTNFQGKSRETLTERLLTESYDYLVGIGPPATDYIWNTLPDSVSAQRFYCMVLNPEALIPLSKDACGVSLTIPVTEQISTLTSVLPSLSRLGLIFDPRYNESYFFTLQETAAAFGLEMIPLRVSSKKDIPGVLERHWEIVDAIMMIPDRTVISESIIQYIIKEGLLESTAVIGYNHFFHESGAAVSFVFDYGELGRQCAEKIEKTQSGTACEIETPRYQLWINEAVMERLNLPLVVPDTVPVTRKP